MAINKIIRFCNSYLVMINLVQTHLQFEHLYYVWPQSTRLQVTVKMFSFKWTHLVLSFKY